MCTIFDVYRQLEQAERRHQRQQNLEKVQGKMCLYMLFVSLGCNCYLHMFVVAYESHLQQHVHSLST